MNKNKLKERLFVFSGILLIAILYILSFVFKIDEGINRYTRDDVRSILARMR